MIILAGAPLAKLTLDGTAQKKPYVIVFSPIECAAFALGDFSASLKPYVPQLLAPSAMFKHVVKTLTECSKDDNSGKGGGACTTQAYLDINKAQDANRAELKQLEILLSKAFTPNQLVVLSIGSVIVVLGAVGSLIRPVKASILGYPLMAMSIYSAKPAGFLASFAFLFFLAAFAINDIEDLRFPRFNAVRRARQEARRS
ncbi:hypothetical protein DUNSADRAFT_6119 [Dunaliella salina]|uniref:Uncharacterized protein n=1 Tax=Dunaliella salina TaxID=3046 RepID=A0ABQ7H727_DUNSA|nr:hypothetical protein DUNSADRAFT_6119 [Dunaliella salina]|eukprot:KAF5842649.1 hypothetical protein DUNSADRAFT_6119 [Dunaliella salina]